MDLNVNPCADVNSFSLGCGRTFKVLAGKCYAVIGQATIQGMIYVEPGGEFIAPNATYSPLCLNSAWRDYMLLSCDGGVLDLSAMTGLNDGVSIPGGAFSHTIVAQNGGVIDLSGLTQITGPTDDDRLNITVNSGGRIDLSKLATVSHAGGVGRVCFNADGDGDTVLALPSLTLASCTEFHVTKGAKLNAEGSPFTYSATALNADYTDYILFSSDGARSVLDLSAMTELNDGFSSKNTPTAHTIVAQNGGVIDLSGLTKIVSPLGNDSLIIRIDNGTIDLSSLQTMSESTGSVNFSILNTGALSLGDLTTGVTTAITLNGGSAVCAQALRVSKPTTVTLNHANDSLEVVSDFDLGTIITIANPGKGKLILQGDFTFAHRDEAKAPFGKSYVFFNGDGPQDLEVGGMDIDTLVSELANDNFGFGQMVIGEPNKPTAVFLVDRIDNGNRGGFTGLVEALYLFGKKAGPNDPNDGLRILGGSVLYMGGLPVYAAIDSNMTDLRRLFKPGEVMIPFDEGYLCLGKPDVNDPKNLVCNGGFETGRNPPTAGNCVVTLPVESKDIDCWVVAQNTVGWTHESCFPDAGEGQRIADLSSKKPSPQGSTEGQTQAVSQDLQTVPGRLYHVCFDVAVNPCKPAKGDTGLRSLSVSAAGASEKFAFDSVTQVNWQTRTWRFRATDTTTTLTFTGQDEPTTGCGVAIDNMIVLDPNDRDGKHTLTVSSTRGGSVVVSPEAGEPVTVIGPGKEKLTFEHGKGVTLTPLADPPFVFGRWTGLQPGDIKEEDPNSNSVTVVMNRDISANASFHDLIVKIADIDTSGCPTVQATVMVTRTDGNAVEGLREPNFKVYEDGVLQTLITVGPRTSCVDVSLVLDYSDSMDDEAIAAMQVAAKGLVNNMLPQDWGEIIKFADSVKTMQEYTDNRNSLTDAIDNAFTGESTQLYDAICKAVSDTAGQSCTTKAVVVMTDGKDNSSRQCTETGVIDLAKAAGIPVSTIGLGDQINEQALRRIAEETGGTYYHAPWPDQLKGIYDKISKTLNNQYVVTYETGSCPGGVGDNREHTLRIWVEVGESTGEDEKAFHISPAQAN